MIRWLSRALVTFIHGQLVEEHGGPRGIRDPGLLESALARPRNLHAYETVEDVLRLAAAYGFGIARNHPFIDGNKRVALMAMYVFLKTNGVVMTAQEEDAVATMRELASGELTEEGLFAWLARNTD